MYFSVIKNLMDIEEKTLHIWEQNNS